MAPAKFGLFKSRSRDQPEQPSTENLLASSHEQVNSPGSPVPSTSKSNPHDACSFDISLLSLDDDFEFASERSSPQGKNKDCNKVNEQNQLHYQILKNQSTDATSISTLQDDLDDIQHYKDHDSTFLDMDNASTSCDANSIQFDQTSLAASEDLSVYCGNIKKPKKSRSKEEQQIRDFDMWRASNVAVMENLLNRNGNHDEQIKWEAIATARGLCTLTDSCSCGDCHGKFLAEVADGDGGLGAAPLFNAISVGCSLQ